MKTQKEIEAAINKIATGYAHVLTGKRESIEVNAPVAMMQVEEESKLRALYWVLGRQYQSKLK